MSDVYAGIPAVMPPARRRVLAEPEKVEAAPGVGCPPLPEVAWLPVGAGREASPWLDTYIAFSRKWSPRSYDGFHEACGVWLLSTVAARRVVLEMGKSFYTPLYIALAARTSLYAKSTAADIAIETLGAAGLHWLLAADDATPQKFIRDLTAYVPDDLEQRSPAERDRVLNRLAVTGQRGWFYDEFGQHLDSITRVGGHMAEFRGLLRRFDDCKERFEYGTIGRGDDIVERPYLALLASMTPADLQTVAAHNAAMWNDGFFARFAFVTPLEDEHQRARFPEGVRLIPGALIKPLRRWHAELGVAEVAFEMMETGKGTPKPRAIITPKGPVHCTLGEGVGEAFYRYHDALLDLIKDGCLTDLDGNYARLAEKALRIAILLASLENHHHIELRHWARAQEIAERWRASLHALYAQASEPKASEAAAREERVLAVVKKLGQPTVREVKQSIRQLSCSEVHQLLESLVTSGSLGKEAHGRTMRYYLTG
ncbi:MAG: DUF3987 domain-containing protein [Armatimonadota bacterium]